jgi:two-component sensor histidine kinase
MDLRNRVRSMALLHEKLYESQDFTRISFAAYIRSLGDELVRSHGALARGIALRYECEDVELDINTAIPCGLIITELVSNAMKYAFPPEPGDGKPRRASREIRLSLHSRDGVLHLGVADNGCGLPPGLDSERDHSFGLNLVRTLSEQLHGTMTIGRRAGLSFEFQFPSPAGAPGTQPSGGAEA